MLPRLDQRTMASAPERGGLWARAAVQGTGGTATISRVHSAAQSSWLVVQTRLRSLGWISPSGFTRPGRSIGAWRVFGDRVGAVRAFLAIGRSKRFRGSQRRQIRASTTNAMLIVVALAILNCAWLLPVYPDARQVILAANGFLAATGIAGFVLIRTVVRKRPETVLFGLLIAIDLVIAALRLSHPSLYLITAGFLLLLPTAVALAVPWAITLHLSWLVGHAVTVLALASIAPNPGARPEGLAVLLVVSSAISLLGQLAGLRARVRNFVQVQRIRALRRAADRDRTRLDRLNGVLERSAKTDELTGLGNRMSLNLQLEALQSQVERRAERYAILLIDIDRFKAINDESGHLVGDDVLYRVAQTLQSAIRFGDGAYRFGGEEFVVVGRLRPGVQALAVAERVRRAVFDLAIPNPANTPHGRVTVSIGVTSLRAGAGDSETSLAQADVALYLAKAAGRNTCRIAA